MGRLEKKMSTLRQAALEYPWQIIDWKIIFMAGSQPNIYILGNFFNIKHSWRLRLVGLWFKVSVACNLGH